MARLLGNVQATRHVGHHGLDLWSQGHYRIAHLGGTDRLGVEIPGQEEIVVVERFGQFFVENGWILHLLQAQGVARDLEIGRAAWREGVWTAVVISVVAVSKKKKKDNRCK